MMNKKDFKKFMVIILTLFILSCSSESIFSQLSKLQKINNNNNILDSASPSGISLVNNILYIAAMHLFKKENGNVEKVNFSNSYEFVIDLVNISGETYLLVQNKNGQLELYTLKNNNWTIKFKKNLIAIKFLKSITTSGITSAYILALEENGKQIILDLNGNNQTPRGITNDDKFYQISNENKLITGRSSKIWQLNGGGIIKVNSTNEIMAIIETSIRGSKETLVITGREYDASDNQFKIYSSTNNYQTPIFNYEGIGEFIAYFAREVDGIILIGSNSGFVELIKNKNTFILQPPSQSVFSGSYNGSQLSTTKLNDIIPISNKVIYILTQGKGLWKIENKKLTKE
ncbi:hypothetical protein CNO14_04115 [Borrelia miyamotoi]|uniref:Lipoprotein n=2 Tax=Borrelia miyamotoi TaxID=47466 RepID=A0AAP8YS87_9SPIR|nr:hypothetical protein [Borrelia miyamotoi]AHH05388.1 Hypothetical protein BOM_0845 [Borrelia miyamotoi FR64b]ATQ15145.2 hypothetical protein CNO14_04115 [Borrelia miyamotoi]ATQ16327.2 hypothetical protein CNO13_04115 [Borrelia miyamotoi]ATQ17546.2 hypothetical protein CNO12_04120 [Borrelia miyamotoi]ATQ18027.2 hypothetical protein CNO11_00135 [Borrelia miyamotoi]